MSELNKQPDSKDIDLENFFPYVVSTVTRIFHSIMDENLKELGVNVAEWRVLICLSRNETRTLNDIVEFTKLPQPSLSRVISKMNKKGLLTNTKRDADSRFLDIRITEQGRNIVANANSKLLPAVQERLEALSEKDNLTLMNLLKTLAVE